MTGARQRRGRRAGLTILEAMMAATLAAFVTLVVLSLLPQAFRSMSASAARLQASDLAAQMLSEIEALGFSSLTQGSWDGRVPTPPSRSGQPDQFPPSPYPSLQRRFVEGGRERVVDYRFLVQVTPGRDRAGTVASDLKQVEVVVSWEEASAGGPPVSRSQPVTVLVGSP